MYQRGIQAASGDHSSSCIPYSLFIRRARSNGSPGVLSSARLDRSTYSRGSLPTSDVRSMGMLFLSYSSHFAPTLMLGICFRSFVSSPIDCEDRMHVWELRQVVCYLGIRRRLKCWSDKSTLRVLSLPFCTRLMLRKYFSSSYQVQSVVRR